MTRTDERIARLPDPNNSEHEQCSICGDYGVALVIQGGRAGRGTNCSYCGNTVVLCATHSVHILRELAGLSIALLGLPEGR